MRILSLISILFVLNGFSQAEEIKDKEFFLTTIKEAIIANDVSKLETLVYSAGMSDVDKTVSQQSHKTILSEISKSPVDTISFEPLPPYIKSTFVAGGRRYESTAPPAGSVIVRFKSPEAAETNAPVIQRSTGLPYAIVGGAYYLVGIKTTDLGWKGPPDISLGYSITGEGNDKLKIHLKYNVSGVILEDDEIRPNKSFSGQYISEITVVSSDPATDVQLVIRHGGQEIYLSEQLKGIGKLKYSRENP